MRILLLALLPFLAAAKPAKRAPSGAGWVRCRAQNDARDLGYAALRVKLAGGELHFEVETHGSSVERGTAARDRHFKDSSRLRFVTDAEVFANGASASLIADKTLLHGNIGELKLGSRAPCEGETCHQSAFDTTDASWTCGE